MFVYHIPTKTWKLIAADLGPLNLDSYFEQVRKNPELQIKMSHNNSSPNIQATGAMTSPSLKKKLDAGHTLESKDLDMS